MALFYVVDDAFRPGISNLVHHFQALPRGSNDPSTLEVYEVLGNGGLMQSQAFLHIFHITAPHFEQTVDDLQTNGMSQRLKNFGFPAEFLLLDLLKKLIDVLFGTRLYIGQRFHWSPSVGTGASFVPVSG